MFNNIRQDFNEVRDQATDFLKRNDLRPNYRYFLASFGDFFSNIPVVGRLIAREPEILLFAAVQWLVIWLAYLAWTQMLYWIPDSVWHSIEAQSAHHHGATSGEALINVALLAWSFVVVVAAAFPIGLLSAAMVSVHDLRNSGQTSTLGKSLALAERHLGRIWLFSALDNWITVNTILDRLPSKDHHRKAGSELIYYAWKLATMGVVPSLVADRGYVDAGRDSLKLLTSQPGRALGLRFGYSAVCWIVGIAAYVATIVFLPRTRLDIHAAHGIFKFYFWAAWPISVAVGVVCVVVRPFFLLSVAKFYTDVFDVRDEIRDDMAQMTSEGQRGLSWTTWTFVLMVAVIVVTVCFQDRIGMSGFISGLAQPPAN